MGTYYVQAFCCFFFLFCFFKQGTPEAVFLGVHFLLFFLSDHLDKIRVSEFKNVNTMFDAPFSYFFPICVALRRDIKT